jgi:hypothetical protein
VADAAGAHRVGEPVEALFLRPGVAARAEIGIDTPDLPRLQLPPDLAPRRMGRAPLAVPTGTIAARRLTARCQPLDARLLADPIHHPREAELSDAARSLGDLDPWPGLGLGRPLAERAGQAIQRGLRAGLQRRAGDLVEAGPAAMLLDLLPGERSALAPDHLVAPRVDGLLPLSSCRGVGVLWCHGRLRTGVGSFAQGTVPPPRPSAPLAARCPRAATHGAFPRRQTCGVRRRRCSWPRSTALCGGRGPAS